MPFSYTTYLPGLCSFLCVTQRILNRTKNRSQRIKRVFPLTHDAYGRMNTTLLASRQATKKKAQTNLFSTRLRSLRQMGACVQENFVGERHVRPVRDPVPMGNVASTRPTAVACPPDRTSGGRGTACSDR